MCSNIGYSKEHKERTRYLLSLKSKPLGFDNTHVAKQHSLKDRGEDVEHN